MAFDEEKMQKMWQGRLDAAQAEILLAALP